MLKGSVRTSAEPARASDPRPAGRFRSAAAFYLLTGLALWSLYLAVHDWHPACPDDCGSYIVLLWHRPWEANFWHIFATTYRRYMTVPLVFSFFGAPPAAFDRIAFFQTLVSFAAWTLLAAAASSLLPSRAARRVVFLLLAVGMFSRGYFWYDGVIVSDSLAWSLVLVWIAATLRYDLLRRTRLRLVGPRWPLEAPLYLALTVATAAARDANAFLLVASLPLLLPSLFERRISWRQALTMCLAVLVSFALVVRASRQRNAVDMADIVAGVVFQRPGALAYFVSHGMPAPSAPERYRLLGPHDSLRGIVDDRHFVLGDFASMRHAVLTGIPGFLAGGARMVYARWLLGHPSYVLHNVVASWDVMFEQWAGERARGLDYDGRRQLAPFAVWFDWLSTAKMLVLAGLLILLSVFGRGEGWRLVAAGAALVLSGFSNAVLGFHGDVWELSEMARHCWIGNLTLHLGLALVVIGSFDRLWRRARGAPTAR